MVTLNCRRYVNQTIVAKPYSQCIVQNILPIEKLINTSNSLQLSPIIILGVFLCSYNLAYTVINALKWIYRHRGFPKSISFVVT